MQASREQANSIDINKEFVEQYIENNKETYGPDQHLLSEIYHTLLCATVNNHFDYITITKEILPKLEKLMQ